MRSMTGYGEGAARNQRYLVTVSARSVNHRFLDLNVRLPESHRACEREVETLARERLRRGRVELRVTIETAGERAVRIAVDRGAVAELRRQLRTLAEEGLVEDRLGAGDLFRLPGLVQLEPEPMEWSAEDGALLATAVGAALDQLVEARRSEGERLAEILNQRLSRLEQAVERMSAHWGRLREGAAAELRERLRTLFSELDIDEGKVLQEAALLVERGDVREELDRLRSHCAHFREVMGGDGSLGKRLDFLSQEILRELNTTGSKCRDADMLREVVESKLLSEQLREQIQNVE